MAFDIKKMSGNIGGGSAAPNIFSYQTPDTETVVQAAQYFQTAGPFLTVGDFIFSAAVNNTATPDIGITQVMTRVPDYGGGYALTVADIKTAANGGDNSGTDGAGLKLSNLSGNVGSGYEGFKLYSYRNNSNTMAQIVASGYFNGATFLQVGDLILTVASDRAKFVKVVGKTAAGVITTAQVLY